MCEICDIINGKKEALIIYKDSEAIAFFPEQAFCLGHIVVAPVEHFQILEQLSDGLVSKLFVLANKLSIASFESKRFQGTNILINNGVAAGQSIAHLCINIIPRSNGDGISFSWSPKQLSQEELSSIELMLKQLDNGNVSDGDKSADSSDANVIEENPDEENYLLKQIERIP